MECHNVTLLKTFRKRCNRVVEIRNNDNSIISRTKNKLIIGSPLMALDKLDFVAKKVETISISQRKLASECYKKECDENGGMLVLPDKDVSEIFSEDVEALSDKYFDDKKVSKNDLSRLVFKECCMNMRKTIDDPKKKNGIRYSPLLLRHATVLRNKLKDDKYSFLAKTFGYPSTTTLNRYSSSSWKDENGLCHKVLDVKRSDLEKSNKCLDRLDSRRTG